MKKSHLLCCAVLLLPLFLLGQSNPAPQGFKYQAVARDASHKPYAETPLKVRIYLKDGGLFGTIFYLEEHDVTTSDIGIFNLNVGQGTAMSGSFANVPWQSGLINLKIELSLNDGAGWITMGESPLLSVPYALYANAAPPDDDGDPANELQLLSYDSISRQLQISDGNAVTLPAPVGKKLVDSDGDTRVEVEREGDTTFNNQVWFKIKGNYKMGLMQNDSGFVRLEMSPAVGFHALQSNTTGTDNAAFGYGTLYNNTTGYRNTAVGNQTLYNNTTGYSNTAVGAEALVNNTTAIYNTAVGVYAMHNNTSGNGNVALGSNALHFNTVGVGNTALGGNALYSETSAGYNTAVGFDAMRSNTTGAYNTAMGYNALYRNTTANYNTAIGTDAMWDNVTGTHNVAIGTGAMWGFDSGVRNIAIGDSTLFWGGGGYSYENVALGYKALYGLATGNSNTAVGFNSNYNLNNGSLNTALGWDAGTHLYASINNTTALGAGASTNANNQVRIGNTSVTSIGGYVGWTNLSDGRYKLDMQQNVPGLDLILQLKPVTYRLDMHQLAAALDEDRLIGEDNRDSSLMLKKFRDEKSAIRYTGFVAQEVEAAAAGLGFDFSGVDKPANEEGFYGLRYAEFTVPLVKAVQEQQAQIEALKQENAALKAQVNELLQIKAQVEALQALMQQKQ